jgi:hypothetical protein
LDRRPYAVAAPIRIMLSMTSAVATRRVILVPKARPAAGDAPVPVLRRYSLARLTSDAAQSRHADRHAHLKRVYD